MKDLPTARLIAHSGSEAGRRSLWRIKLPEVVISYCTVDDVCSQFPRFVRAQPNSIADATIQTWLDDAAAYIYAQFFSRKIDLANLPPGATTAQQQIQAYILRSMNRDSGVKDLAAILKYSTNAVEIEQYGAPQEQGPKTPLAASRFRDGRFSEIMRGSYDQIFMPGIARTVSVTPTIQGSIAGGDTDPSLTTPESEGLNALFSLRQEF